MISGYEQAVSEKEAAEGIDYDAERKKAEEYNEALLPCVLPDSFALAESSGVDPVYMNTLNIAGDEMMGSVEIPKINIKIPIYHTTEEEVLNKGAGHLEGSSLPVGGANTHAVISAHRGLPSASLFTDLDQMKTGDLFFLNVLGEKLGSTRQIKSDVNYYILLHSQLPTIISECGFLSNPEEEQRLCTEEYQERIADALYCGIIEYLMMNMN